MVEYWAKNGGIMDIASTLTIIVSILVPMFICFGWIIHRLGSIENRLTVVETVLAMMGMPIKPGNQNKE